MAAQKVTNEMIYGLLKDHVEKDERMFKEIQEALDGCEEYPGVRGRLDRIERKAESAARTVGWTIKSLAGAIITGVTAWIISQFGGK